LVLDDSARLDLAEHLVAHILEAVEDVEAEGLVLVPVEDADAVQVLQQGVPLPPGADGVVQVLLVHVPLLEGGHRDEGHVFLRVPAALGLQHGGYFFLDVFLTLLSISNGGIV